MKHFVIIDGLSFLFRAYYAVRHLTRSDGLNTNALYGFSQMLIKVVGDLKPNLCTVALDSIEKNFRYNIYPAYKANRKAMDEELKEQMPHFEPMIDAFDILGLRVEGFEADDIIATLVKEYKNDYKITIVSSDKDLMQLISENVTMLDTMKNKVFDDAAVIEKFGVAPNKVIDAQSLIGDSSDNIPGVKGVGPKTAAQLLGEFNSLDNLYSNLDKIPRDKLRNKLLEEKDNAYLSRQLVTLCSDVPLNIKTSELDFHPDISSAQHFMEEMEFNTLAQRVVKAGELARTRSTGLTTSATASKVTEQSQTNIKELKPKSPTKYVSIQSKSALDVWVDRIYSAGVFAIDTETTSIDAMKAKLVGISLCINESEACYIPLGHELDMLDTSTQLSKEDVLPKLKLILEDESITKVGQNIKYDMLIFRHEGIYMQGVEDTMIMSYCLDGGKHNHGMDWLASFHLGHTCTPFKEVCGTGKKQITFDKVDINTATNYAAEDADITIQLYNLFKKRIDDPQMAMVKEVYTHIEKPLIPVLTAMEWRGVHTDRSELEKLSKDFTTRLNTLEKDIWRLAGEEFNINSTQQLAVILFDKMGLTHKGKSRSTKVEVMEKLAGKGYEIASKVLEYRHLAKLRSTYTDSLIQQINPHTGRVHTIYNQSGAATGRLSSSDPNLQNIPIRTEDGRKIRHAFTSPTGKVLMSADYSQIELRLLAHMAECKPLQDAFNENKDIHTHTAHQIFGIELDNVTSDQRRVAKIINFGIIYGMGAASLGKNIGVSSKEAAAYIENYFHRYKGIREFMDTQIDFAKANGYVETMYGRRVHLPNINSKNGGLKAGAERSAINAPLQGTNADLIKMAMAKIEEALNESNLGAEMLMQVHDELIFEIPADEVEATKALVLNIMENIAELTVPLKVGVGVGNNWEDAH